jgi:hypothetical protein
MDAQGAVKVKGLGKTSLINVVDKASRLKVESAPRVGVSKPATADYYITLRRAFLNHGLPQRLSLDHDTVFIDNTSPSPFPTRLHLWLIALGVDVIFIRKGRPTDHAIVERTHQTMAQQAPYDRFPWESQQSLWERLDERRAALNQYLPIRALNNQASLEAYPEALYSGRPYRPEWEEDILNLERLYQYLAQGRWFRQNRHGIFSLGGYDYYCGARYAGQTVEVSFDPTRIAFLCQPEDNVQPILVPTKGLAKADLMGDLADLLTLPVYQLALPFAFTVEDQRRAALVSLLGDTTL